jgi:acetone carboxylase gamma subunit
MNKEVSERMALGNLKVMQKNGKRMFVCECGCVLCPVTDNFKVHVLKRDRPLTEMQPTRFSGRASTQFVMREYVCPKCGGLFEVDLMPRDKPEDVPTMLLKES